MEVSVKRYSFGKEFIATGVLKISYEGQTTFLKYTDFAIEVTASGLYHPIAALENLRKILEFKHESLIGLTGCRIDSAIRPNSGGGTYLLIYGIPSSERAFIFDPTEQVEKLCTVDEHKAAYREWGNSILNRK